MTTTLNSCNFSGTNMHTSRLTFEYNNGIKNGLESAEGPKKILKSLAKILIYEAHAAEKEVKRGLSFQEGESIFLLPFIKSFCETLTSNKVSGIDQMPTWLVKELHKGVEALEGLANKIKERFQTIEQYQICNKGAYAIPNALISEQSGETYTKNGQTLPLPGLTKGTFKKLVKEYSGEGDSLMNDDLKFALLSYVEGSDAIIPESGQKPADLGEWKDIGTEFPLATDILGQLQSRNFDGSSADLKNTIQANKRHYADTAFRYYRQDTEQLRKVLNALKYFEQIAF